MESRYEKFINCEAYRSATEKLNKNIDSYSIELDLLNFLPHFSSSFLPRETTLYDFLHDGNMITSFSNFLLEENLLLSSDFFINSSTFNVVRLVNDDDFYNFHKNLPIDMVKYAAFNNCDYEDKDYSLIRELIINLMVLEENYEIEVINMFSQKNFYNIVFESIYYHPGVLPLFTYLKDSSLESYILSNISDDYFIFMETFNNFTLFRTFIKRLDLFITKNNMNFIHFDMGKFCELSDENIPFEWNMELYLIECAVSS